jgi:hypothetical protein
MKAILLAAFVLATLALISPLTNTSPHSVAAAPGWQVTLQTDRASYVPGDSGSLTVTIINTNTNSPLEIRNITAYFPWAGYAGSSWQGNVTKNISPFAELTSMGGGGNTYSYQTGFTVPNQFISSGGSSCPFLGSNGRYGIYSSCILIGMGGNYAGQYQTSGLQIPIAFASYTPLSLVAYAIPIATLVVLIVATAFLFMSWNSIRRLTPATPRK